MNTLFISDLHLSEERPAVIALFLEFLVHSASRAEALYILGDLFEAWVGDDAVMPALQPVISALKAATGKGTSIYVMHGNRDFLLKEKFEKISGCHLIPDPTVIDLHGVRTLLMHGDTLCTDDLEYQQFRKDMRDPERQRQLLALPVAQRIVLAKQLRQMSYEKNQVKAQEIMDVNQHTVEEAMRLHHAAQLIHGHTHRPAVHEFNLDGHAVKRIVLGDWHEQGSVLECGEKECRLISVDVGLRGYAANPAYDE
jgi:UDP-2,3-diacylglucosamine hydrolase